jgi:hypothetical protein
MPPDELKLEDFSDTQLVSKELSIRVPEAPIGLRDQNPPHGVSPAWANGMPQLAGADQMNCPE